MRSLVSVCGAEKEVHKSLKYIMLKIVSLSVKYTFQKELSLLNKKSPFKALSRSDRSDNPYESIHISPCLNEHYR